MGIHKQYQAEVFNMAKLNRDFVRLENDFTIIPNEILRNKEMKSSTKNILLTMMGLPTEWDFSIAGISACVYEGRETVQKALVELEKLGYITRKRERKENGTLGAMIYTIHQFPVSESENTYKNNFSNQDVKNHKQVKPKQVSETQISTYNKIKNQNNKTVNSASETHDSDFDFEILQKVTELTDDETIIEAIQYYLDKYKRFTGKNHPNVSKSALENIIYNIQEVLQDEWDDVVNEDGLERMISRHFKTDYGQDIDYNIVHFGIEKILEYQARNVGLITGRRD